MVEGSDPGRIILYRGLRLNESQQSKRNTVPYRVSGYSLNIFTLA